MGCSTSKPSKSTRKLSKPSKPTPLIPLSYPYLEPLPFRPLPHHPVASGLTPEQEFASRYGRMLVENPIFAGTQKYETACRPQMRKETAPVPQQSKRVKAAKPKALYQLKPLNEIGATTPANQSGYSLYPSGQKGDFRDDVSPHIAPLKISRNKPKGKQQARFGGMKQDRHGEWWVLVLADKNWYRAKEMGVEPSCFR